MQHDEHMIDRADHLRNERIRVEYECEWYSLMTDPV
jgi:hypothetical protein